MTRLLRQKLLRPSRILPLLALAALAAAPFLGFGDRFALTLLARAMILGMAAVSLSLLVGGAGLASLGHAAMMGIGAYVVAALDLAGITEGAIAFPAAILAAAGFAGITGLVALRTSGVYFIMITLAFGQMLFFTLSALSALGGDDGYTLYGRNTLLGADILTPRLGFHFICLGLLAASWGLCALLLRSRFGRVLRAARENPLRVEALGFSPFPYRLLASVIAGGIAGLAGALLANATEFVSPALASWPRSAELLFMVVLGGVAQLPGALVGALAFVLLEEGLAHGLTHWKLVFGPLLVLSVIFLPAGLTGGLALRRRPERGADA
jgi:branched-chain amino acid transport system permease protein